MAGHSDDASIHVVSEDGDVIAFLDQWPHLYGWTLIDPREHCVPVTGDFLL